MAGTWYEYIDTAKARHRLRDHSWRVVWVAQINAQDLSRSQARSQLAEAVFSARNQKKPCSGSRQYVGKMGTQSRACPSKNHRRVSQVENVVGDATAVRPLAVQISSTGPMSDPQCRA